jgi:hypothetical protein
MKLPVASELFSFFFNRYGPVMTWLLNHNFTTFIGLSFVSQAISALIASERCFCVLRYQSQPLVSKTLSRITPLLGLALLTKIL